MKLSLFFCTLAYATADSHGDRMRSIFSRQLDAPTDISPFKASDPDFAPISRASPTVPNPNPKTASNQSAVSGSSTTRNSPNPTLQDFQNLYSALATKFITERNIPKYVRMAFHDVINFDSETGTTGAQGCVIDSRTVASYGQNSGLAQHGVNLKFFARSEFPTIRFSTGDLVSLAGKVAFEKAFPCIKIKWSFGRPRCERAEIKGGPGPDINSLEKMKPFLNRYGLSTTEMGLLTVGGHGLANAVNTQRETGIPSFRFARVSSGVDFIKRTLNMQYQLVGSWFDPIQRSSIGRLHSDLLFFPSTLRKIAGAWADPSPELAATERTLLSYTESSFNKDFGTVFAKMLLIGTDGAKLTPFSEGSATC